MEQSIESKVAQTILEKEADTIELDGETYKIASPSIATLILVSEIVSTLPVVEKVSKDQITYSVLHNARFFKPLGEIAAVLILGAKGITQTETKEIEEKHLFGLIRKKKSYQIKIDKKSELAKIIIENMKPTILFNVIVKRLTDMEIGDFFAITTSLSEANILKPTKEVGVH